MPSDVAIRLTERTMRFALRTIRLCQSLPESWEGRFVADQLFRAAARTAANYRAACRARSRRDFVNKLGMAVEEADESAFWLEFAARVQMTSAADHRQLLQESLELVSILNSSAKTAADNLKSSLHH